MHTTAHHLLMRETHAFRLSDRTRGIEQNRRVTLGHIQRVHDAGMVVRRGRRVNFSAVSGPIRAQGHRGKGITADSGPISVSSKGFVGFKPGIATILVQ